MKHMEEMKIAGLAMALCIVMLGIYIVVPKDGNISHLTAIPDNNAAEPVPDSTSQGCLKREFYEFYISLLAKVAFENLHMF